jgi:predicted aspartyl protease
MRRRRNFQGFGLRPVHYIARVPLSCPLLVEKCRDVLRKFDPTAEVTVTRQRSEKRRSNVLCAVASVLVFIAASAAAPSNDGAPPVSDILAIYGRATNDANVKSFESSGVVSGEGLTGDFHSWRSGPNERDDERLGPRSETTLRLGDHIYLRTSSGNVRELTGYLRRRALTADFVDSGTFVNEPERSTFIGFGTLGRARAWRLEVRAVGGEPETLWIDTATGLPLRVEYLDGDGPTTIDFSDWRDVEGRRFPFKAVTSDGERQFDVVQQTTSIAIDAPVSADVFTPPRNRTIQADGVQTVPLFESNSHIACNVGIGGKTYAFLLDTGAQSVLLDSSVAKAAGLTQFGALEVRGASRTGGLHVLTLPRIDIGLAHLDNIVATSLDLHGMIGGVSRIDGILGFPFFASSLVELDFTHHTMRFGMPGSFAPRGQRVPLDVDRGLVEANFRLDQSIDAPFIVDTGNSGELLLYRPFVTAHPGIVPASTESVANYGIGGAAPTYRSTLDELLLGDVPLYHRVTDVVMADKGAFADQVDAGNVGMGILKNFIVTFDLSNGALYLEKGAGFDDGRLRTATNPS